MPCVRLDCPHYRLHGESRRHGYCCNACRRGETEHTKNCSGYIIHKRSRSPPLIANANQLPMRRRPERGPYPPLLAFTSLVELPMLRSSENVHSYIEWYGQRYCMSITAEESLQSWRRFILDWSEHWSLELMKDPLRPVVFHALSRERWLTSPYRMACPMVDVGALGLDAKSATYNMGEVTGFNFEVQAWLVQQAQLPDILRQAMIAVRDAWRRGEAAHYVFVCDHGTHRSVGVALLALQLLCPAAAIAVGTLRVQKAAVQAGFKPICQLVNCPFGVIRPLAF